MSIQHFLSMSIVPSLDGYTCTWFEPVVIRGQLGPNEEKPKDSDAPADPVIDQADPESVVAQKMAGHMSDMLGALKQPLMDLQRQKVYRLVARAKVFKHGEDPRDAMMDLTRAQRLLSALNVEGAILEEANPGSPPGIPFFSAGLNAGTGQIAGLLRGATCARHGPQAQDPPPPAKRKTRRKPKR